MPPALQPPYDVLALFLPVYGLALTILVARALRGAARRLEFVLVRRPGDAQELAGNKAYGTAAAVRWCVCTWR